MEEIGEAATTAHVDGRACAGNERGRARQNAFEGGRNARARPREREGEEGCARARERGRRGARGSSAAAERKSPHPGSAEETKVPQCDFIPFTRNRNRKRCLRVTLINVHKISIKPVHWDIKNGADVSC